MFRRRLFVDKNKISPKNFLLEIFGFQCIRVSANTLELLLEDTKEFIRVFKGFAVFVLPPTQSLQTCATRRQIRASVSSIFVRIHEDNSTLPARRLTEDEQ